jgi:hypothetical protein
MNSTKVGMIAKSAKEQGNSTRNRLQSLVVPQLGPNAPCRPQSGVNWGCVDPGHQSLDRTGKPLGRIPAQLLHKPSSINKKKRARLCPGHPTTAHPTTRSQPAFLVTSVVSSSRPEPPLLLRSLATTSISVSTLSAGFSLIYRCWQ